MSGAEIRIFAGSSGKKLAERMCSYLGTRLGSTETTTFAEGNTYVQIGENVRGKEVYVVQPIGLRPNDELVELLFWMDAFKRSGATYVTAVVPYFGYAKGDKKDEPRVSIRARVCAECIELAGADRLITLDLHAPQIQGFFKKPVDHLHFSPLLAEYLRRWDLHDAVIVSPDAGFAKQARKFAGRLRLPVAISDKTRTCRDAAAEVLELIGDVKDRTAVIVDDFSITAGTLTNLAQMLRQRGARRVHACLSHLPLCESGLRAIENSPIETIVGTDTLDNPLLAEEPRFQIVSVAPLFAEAVRRMANRESLSDLFDTLPPELVEASFRV